MSRRLARVVPMGLALRVLENSHYFGWPRLNHQRALGHPATIFADDTFLVSYPRSGNTWLRFLMAGLLWNGEVSFPSVYNLVPDIHDRSDADLRLAPFPRFLKSHSSLNVRYPRVVYLVRDGRDAAVSLYHLRRRRGATYPSFSNFLDKWLKGQIGTVGPWHTHVLGWLAQREERPFLLISYEDMRDDTGRELARIVEFAQLQVGAVDIARALQVGEFSRMREAEKKHRPHLSGPSNQFEVRKGVSGDWRNYFSAADLDYFWELAGPAMSAAGYQHQPD